MLGVNTTSLGRIPLAQVTMFLGDRFKSKCSWLQYFQVFIFMVKSPCFIIFHHLSTCFMVNFTPFWVPIVPKNRRVAVSRRPASSRPAPRAAPCGAPSCASCARQARRGGRRHTAPGDAVAGDPVN